VWRAIIERMGRRRYLQLSTISKSLRDAHAATGFKPETSLRIMCENIELCQSAREQGCPWDERLCAAAAAAGHLDTLKWARGHGAPITSSSSHPSSVSSTLSSILASMGALALNSTSNDSICPWDTTTAAAAAGGGHLETLQWAVSSGCPLETSACWAAALGGRLQVLRWLHQQTPRCEWAGWAHADVAAAMAAGGSGGDGGKGEQQRQLAVPVMRHAVDKAPGMKGKAAAVVAILGATMQDRVAQQWGMTKARELAYLNDHRRELTEAGACEALAAGLRAHSADATVQHAGINALASLTTAGCVESANRLIEAGACAAVVSAMVAHINDHHVQQACMWCVSVIMLSAAQSATAASFGAAGVYEALVRSMRAHPADADIQRQSASVVLRLSVSSVDHSIKDRLGAAGTCEAIVAALLELADSYLQSGCMTAVQALASGHTANADRLVAAGACEAVVAGMRACASEGMVQSAGASAISALALHSTRNRARLAQAGAREVLAAATHAHPADVAVQFSAARALEHFA
jgi:hypothetical protein